MPSPECKGKKSQSPSGFLQELWQALRFPIKSPQEELKKLREEKHPKESPGFKPFNGPGKANIDSFSRSLYESNPIRASLGPLSTRKPKRQNP
jgi:hypothetical protein